MKQVKAKRQLSRLLRNALREGMRELARVNFPPPSTKAQLRRMEKLLREGKVKCPKM